MNKKRMEILKNVINKEKQRLLLKSLKQKNKKLEKQIKSITEYQCSAVLERYMRYCKDCWLVYHLEWKRRLAEFNMDVK